MKKSHWFISDTDIITFLISELKQSATSPVYNSAAIRKIIGSFNNTSFIGFGEELDDIQDGIYNPGENFTDTNGNRVWDEGERFIDGNGIWDDAEDFTDANDNKIYDEKIGEKLDIYMMISFFDDNKNVFYDNKKIMTDGCW